MAFHILQLKTLLDLKHKTMTQVTPTTKEKYKVIIKDIDFGILHQSEIRNIIEKLDNGIN